MGAVHGRKTLFPQGWRDGPALHNSREAMVGGTFRVERRSILEEQDFDRRAAELGITLSRRSLVKGAIGGSAAALAGSLADQGADAARRGYSGSTASTNTSVPMWRVQISFDEVYSAFRYSTTQDASGDSRSVLFTTTWSGVISIEISIEGSVKPILPVLGPSGSAGKRFDQPGQYDFRAYVSVGRKTAYGPWAVLHIS